LRHVDRLGQHESALVPDLAIRIFAQRDVGDDRVVRIGRVELEWDRQPWENA